MKIWPLLFVVALGSGITPRSTAQVSPGLPVTYEELETIIVTGERPGPALWKVSRKGNTLWILPTFGPLPEGLIWRSTQLEAVIQQSQEIYFLTHISAPQNPGNDARLLQAVQNLDGRQLRDVMPADLYRQFSDLAQRYAGDSRAFESFRPFVATDALRQVAMQRLRLTSERVVPATVQDLARQRGVKNVSAVLRDNRDWDRMISELAKTPREADIPCARARLDRLETDLRESVARANAWARGDLETLRQDPGLYIAQADAEICARSFRQLKVTRARNLGLRKVSYSWSVRALKKNRSTLILVPVATFFDTDGLLSKFKAAGYEVEQPPLH
ncbi:MAG: TraB/GumN family protein [Steroidobacteraceae bacterium]